MKPCALEVGIVVVITVWIFASCQRAYFRYDALCGTLIFMAGMLTILVLWTAFIAFLLYDGRH